MSCIDSTEDAQRALSVMVFDAVVVVVTPAASPAQELASLCRSTTTPVLVLAAAQGDAGVVNALDAGAADAVAFPCSGDELLARLRLALRRRRTMNLARAMRLGDLALDVDAGAVQLAGRRVDLSRLEYRLLVELMIGGGRVVSREHLLERLWGVAPPERLNDLRVHVNRLRAKLGREGAVAPSIVSVPGVGYRLDEV